MRINELYTILAEVYLFEKTISWWKSEGASDRNKKFYAIRKKLNNMAYLRKASIVNDNKGAWHLHLFFDVVPTYGRAEKMFNKKGQEISPLSFYKVEFMFMNCKDELEKIIDKDTRYKEKLKIMSNIIHNKDVKFYSNDPSFFIQGAWYRLAKYNASIYPFPKGFTDKGIWGAKHGKPVYITKHILNIIEILPFNTPELVHKILKSWVPYKRR